VTTVTAMMAMIDEMAEMAIERRPLRRPFA
jgi:hypothetical protein